MDEYHQVLDTVFVKMVIADNHDFMALPNGNYILFAYDEQPYAMDTVVVGGDQMLQLRDLLSKNWIKTKTCYFNGELGSFSCVGQYIYRYFR